jgi:hypothetical protein
MKKFNWRRGLGTGAGVALLAFPLSAMAGQTTASAAVLPSVPVPAQAHPGYWTVTDLGDGCTAADSLNNADDIVAYIGADSDLAACSSPILNPLFSTPPDGTSVPYEDQLNSSMTGYNVTTMQQAAGDSYAIATGINASGQSVGYSLPSGRAVEFDPTGANPATPLAQLPGTSLSYAQAVSNGGLVAGTSQIGSNTVATEFSLSGPARELGPVQGFSGSYASAISPNGSTLVGYSTNANGDAEASQWMPVSAGISVGDLGDLPSSSGATTIASLATGVNDGDTAVGGELDTFGSGAGATSDEQATEYSGDFVVGLGFLPSDDASWANAINNEGVAVGYSGNIDQSNPTGYPLANQEAVEFSNGTVTALNSFPGQAGSGWNYQIAQSINDDGQIVGEGTYNGVENAFLLTPPPTVTSVSPADGPAAGGTSVTISGTGLNFATAVDFGTAAATNVHVVSPTEITATAPAGSGTVDVTVTTALAGQGTPSVGDQFIYEPAPPAGTTSSASGVSTSPTGTASATEGGISASAQGEGAVTVATYSGNPTASTAKSPSGQYFDVDLSPGNTFTSVTIDDCKGAGANNLEWYNPAANSGAGAFQPVVGDPGPTYTPASGSSPACVTVTLTQSTSPTIAEITGTVFAGEEPLKTTLSASPALLQLDGLKLYLLTLNATLTDAAGPVAGQMVVFTAGSTTICSAMTAANGTATCSGLASILSIALGAGYTATYAGSSVYAPSNARGSLIS